MTIGRIAVALAKSAPLWPLVEPNAIAPGLRVAVHSEKRRQKSG